VGGNQNRIAGILNAGGGFDEKHGALGRLGTDFLGVLAVVHAGAEDDTGLDGGEDFGDVGWAVGGVDSGEEVAFELRGAAVGVDFSEAGAALGVEVALDFHEVMKSGQFRGVLPSME
jgi:hypothetical protein